MCQCIREDWALVSARARRARRASVARTWVWRRFRPTERRRARRSHREQCARWVQGRPWGSASACCFCRARAAFVGRTGPSPSAPGRRAICLCTASLSTSCLLNPTTHNQHHTSHGLLYEHITLLGWWLAQAHTISDKTWTNTHPRPILSILRGGKAKGLPRPAKYKNLSVCC